MRKVRTFLGRVVRDIERKVKGNDALVDVFRRPLWLAGRVRDQRQNQRGKKVFSLHAPEVECIGKGKAHRPYEFGVKVSVATTLHRSKGGQFIVHARALPGAPYDGHTLATVIPEMEKLIGAPMQRILADRGYRGHNAPEDRKFRVFIAGQKRRMTKARCLARERALLERIGALNADRPPRGVSFLVSPN